MRNWQHHLARHNNRIGNDRRARAVMAGLCLYEAGTILAGKDDLMISALCRKRRWLAPAMLALLACHLYAEAITTPGAVA